jgi:uncharacterized membrane protein HdeD (DUF308 family)
MGDRYNRGQRCSKLGTVALANGLYNRSETITVRTLMFRRVIRTIAKVLSGIAALVFFFAPVTTDTGWLLMACSIVVGISCFAIWKGLEDNNEDADSPD